MGVRYMFFIPSLPTFSCTYFFPPTHAMPKVASPGLELEVLKNYQPGMSWRYLARIVRKKNMMVTDKTCRDIVERNGKRREAAAAGETYQEYHRPSKVTGKVLKMIERRVSVENPMTQKSIALQVNVCQATVHNVIHNVLDREKRKKTVTHVVNANERKNRKRNCWKLYKYQLAGDKCIFVVTLDESWIRLKVDGGVTSFCYVKRGETVPKEWIKSSRTLWEEKFMVIGVMTYNRTFPLIRVPKGTNVDSEFYVNQVLKPLIRKQLVPYFKDDISKVFIHHDKSSVHTSEHTKNFMEQMNKKYGINFIQKADIPIKGADCSPMDFFGFGFIKQSVERMKFDNVDQLWKKCKKVWKNVPVEMCNKTFESWKIRCRQIQKEEGNLVEQLKEIHKRKLPLKNHN